VLDREIDADTGEGYDDDEDDGRDLDPLGIRTNTPG
jgi:hypothetical protein